MSQKALHPTYEELEFPMRWEINRRSDRSRRENDRLIIQITRADPT